MAAKKQHTLGTGLDIGTMNIVSARREGEDTTTNRVSYWDGSWDNGPISTHASTSTTAITFDSSAAFSSTTKLVQFNYTADAEL